jgi:hypothetical protein
VRLAVPARRLRDTGSPDHDDPPHSYAIILIIIIRYESKRNLDFGRVIPSLAMMDISIQVFAYAIRDSLTSAIQLEAGDQRFSRV